MRSRGQPSSSGTRPTFRATVIGIGVATIAAAIGAGSLGVFIFRGVAMVDNRTILAGALPTAALAVGAELAQGAVERRVRPPR